MDRPSLKKTIISKLSAMTNIESFENNDINLLTSVGIISGKLYKISDSDNEITAYDVLAKFTNNITVEYNKTYSVKLPTPENDGFITLKDVTLRQTDSTVITNLPMLTIFYDQVIGIFLGNISINE